MGYAKYMEDDMEIRLDRLEMFAWRVSKMNISDGSTNSEYGFTESPRYVKVASTVNIFGGNSYERSGKV